MQFVIGTTGCNEYTILGNIFDIATSTCAEDNNVWSYTSTPAIRLLGVVLSLAPGTSSFEKEVTVWFQPEARGILKSYPFVHV
jgi:hypothetical protein